jgi:peptide/nickel transport system substrate-binding protein
LTSAAAQVGIKISSAAKTFNFLIQNYDNPSATSNENKWAVNDFGGLTNDSYPTTNAIFHTGGIYNLGSYSDAKADALINASVFGASAGAVKSEAQYLTSQQPALFQPTPSLVFGASKRVGGDARGFLALTQYALFPQFFYLTK